MKYPFLREGLTRIAKVSGFARLCEELQRVLETVGTKMYNKDNGSGK